ncbi:Protein transport protein BOS1 [Hanseniaspora osmophila]|uniref:Protein transport protein BOS1 n=1 Tax=Hanseniaspora osmophila TaxID=56408 RepID=A0A1E5REY4_9ASCO|nr:Protein transport protein BOS1 [Hanseniaspora osmophila]
MSHATKQKQLLTKDLSKLEENIVSAPISLQGSITTTLLSLEKTIVKYKQQLENFKQTSNIGAVVQDEEETAELLKYETRLNILESEYANFKDQFTLLKERYQEEQSKLLQTPNNGINTMQGKSSSSTNPFTDTSNTTMTNRRTQGHLKDFGDGSGTGQLNTDYQDSLRNEESILARGNQKLDYILEMGQHSLDDIMDQNQVLEKMQKTMTKSLSTLGVSNETIERINKRVFKDRLVFYIALILFFVGVYLVLKFLRR